MENYQEYLVRLERELKLRNYSKNTVDIYTGCIKYFLKWCSKVPEDLSRNEIINFILLLQEKNKAPKTVNLYKFVIIFFYNEVLNIDKKIDIKLSKKARKLPVILSKNDVLKLIDNTNNIKHKFVLKIAYGAGLRVSEVNTLKVGDFDYDNLTIHIKGAKGNKDRITIFPESLKDEIIRRSAGKNGSDLLIESNRGGKIAIRSIQNIFNKALKKSGIKKDVSFHSLRHSFATHLLENGVDIRYIQELLGHSNIRTTQIYTKVMNPKLNNIKSPL